MKIPRLTGIAISAALSFLLSGAALGQAAYPAKPIRFIVPFPPGGGTDVVSRALTREGGEVLGGTPTQFAELLKSEQAKWAKAVRDSGAKVD